MIQLLLVDDDDINNFLLKYLLKKSGFEVETQVFINPAEAVQYVKKCKAEGQTIDLILLDINMPLMSGWEVLDELRVSGESLIYDSKIFMLSSSVYTTDIDRADKYTEVSGFISKPIGLEKLTEIFTEITAAKVE